MRWSARSRRSATARTMQPSSATTATAAAATATTPAVLVRSCTAGRIRTPVGGLPAGPRGLLERDRERQRVVGGVLLARHFANRRGHGVVAGRGRGVERHSAGGVLAGGGLRHGR